MDNSTPGTQIREWLEQTQQDQKALAAALDISEGHVSSLISGRRTPSLDLALRIERLTGVRVGMWQAPQPEQEAEAQP